MILNRFFYSDKLWFGLIAPRTACFTITCNESHSRVEQKRTSPISRSDHGLSNLRPLAQSPLLHGFAFRRLKIKQFDISGCGIDSRNSIRSGDVRNLIIHKNADLKKGQLKQSIGWIIIIIKYSETGISEASGIVE